MKIRNIFYYTSPSALRMYVRERDSGGWRGGEGRKYEWEREFILSLIMAALVFPFYL